MVEYGKTIIVTGGTSGIGRAASLGFAKAGWRVATCGRRAERLSALTGSGVEIALPCDVTNPDDVEAFFTATVRQFGRIDAVFNNAGAFAPATTFGDLPVETWRRMIVVNLIGAFYVAR